MCSSYFSFDLVIRVTSCEQMRNTSLVVNIHLSNRFKNYSEILSGQSTLSMSLGLLPAATKLGQGNIFTSVCQEFCPQGGRVSASVHAGIHPQGGDTPRTDPPGADTPPDQAHHPPGSRHPLEQTPPTPPPRSRPPSPGTDTPPADTPPDQAHSPPGADTSLGSRLQHTVNERPVRILLECILALGCFSTFSCLFLSFLFLWKVFFTEYCFSFKYMFKT